MSTHADPASSSEPATAIGIDFGSSVCRMALLSTERKMPVILRNSLSNESTPTIVHVPADELRVFGESAAGKEITQPKRTTAVLKQSMMLASQTADEKSKVWSVDRLKQTGCPISADGAGYDFSDEAFPEDTQVTPTRITAFVLRQLMAYANSATKDAPHQRVVITAPPCCTQRYREMLRDACIVAGVPHNVIRVEDEAKALAAYAHHLRYDALPTADSNKKDLMAVVSIGEVFSTVVLCELQQGKAVVHAAESREVGSGLIDLGVTSFCLAAIKEKHKLEVGDQPRAFNKVLRESKKAKVFLSTTEKATIQLESLNNEVDASIPITRSQMEAGASVFVGEFTAMCEAATAKIAALGLKDAPLKVEAVGNGWRSPIVSNVIKRVFGVDHIGLTLDANMCVAEGAAILGALDAQKAAAAAAAEGGAKKDEGDDDDSKPKDGAAPSFVFHSIHGLEISGDSENTIGAQVLCAESAAEVEARLGAELQSEAKRTERDRSFRAQIAAQNEFETLLLTSRDAAAEGPDGDALRSFLNNEDEWSYASEKPPTAEEYKARIEHVKKTFEEKFPEVQAYREKLEKIEAEKCAELERLAKENKGEKELKSDPQRLRAAQERREQGVTLFKQEHYEEAVTRFVQALQHLAELYDTANEETKQTKRTISMSCYLNIATANVKLKRYRPAINNCNQALDLEPENAKALYRRGQARVGINEYDEAKADLEKALQLTNGDAAIKAELELLEKRVAEQKNKEKKMYAKMFA